MAAKKKKKKKTDWTKIETEYVTTNIGQRALADKYGVSVDAINKHSKQGGWVEKKNKNLNEIQTIVEQKTKDAIVDEKVEVNKKHIALYAKGLSVVEQLLDMFMEDVACGEIKKGRATPANLDFIMSAIAKAQKGQRLALNIDNEEITDNKEPDVKIIKGVDIGKI